MNYVIPILLLATLAYGMIKKVPIYDTFTEGIKEALSLTISLLPYIGTVFLLVEIMRESGLSEKISEWVYPLFSLLGIPKELCGLLVLRPLSGSGSLALLKSIYEEYGVDSYVSRVASVIMASTDTVMYVTAIYFSEIKERRQSGITIAISLAASLAGAIVASLLCKVI